MARALGIDVSRYQGAVDWAQVKAAGGGFGIARCTIGLAPIDPRYKANIAGIREQGMVSGAYGVLWPANRNPKGEAEWFVENLGDPLPDLLVFDFELGTKVHPAGHHKLTGRELIDQAELWLRTVERLTARRPIIYTAAWFWNDAKMPTPTDWQDEYDLWVANYQRETPIMPRGWARWTFWQKDNTAKVPGVSGNCDLDVFNGEANELTAYVAAQGAPRLTDKQKLDRLWEAHPELWRA
jgi:lysozyme